MIGEDEIRKAAGILRKYKDSRQTLTRRIIENEQWYKRRHWDLIKAPRDKGVHPEPTSGYLFNCIANKHADAMDNYPECSILPRESSDEQTAQVLSDVLPTLLDYNNFEQVYSDLWYTKLRQGTGIYGVFWDNTKEGGVGDISIKNIDVLNFYFEPGIKDIQDSKNVFITTLMNNEDLLSAYPDLKNKSLNADKSVKNEYIYDDNIDTTEKTTVVDWYYKKYSGGKSVLHFAKFVGDNLLFASENDTKYSQSGWYEHGQYPFVLDGLFPVEGTPFCFGYVDICKPAQMYIDKMDQLILENAYRTGKKRWAVKSGVGINIDDFANWDKSIVECDADPNSGIFPLSQEPLDSTVLNARTLKVEELKETSGNRDFSQGGTASGITAASAIAALQEAGSKLSRDMIKASYNAYTQVCNLCIELMRQFYTESRCFRITKDNQTQFIDFDNSGLAPNETETEFGLSVRKPVFDIQAVAQKKSPFNRVAQNETIKEFFGAGFFNPQNAEQALIALKAMDFEGKEQLEESIKENAQITKEAQMFEMLLASPYGAQIQMILSQLEGQVPAQQDVAGQEMSNNSDLARAAQSAGSLADQARERAQSQAEVAQR